MLCTLENVIQSTMQIVCGTEEKQKKINKRGMRKLNKTTFN